MKYLVTFTQSGDSARRMSRLRSAIPLLAFTPTTSVRNTLSLSWGTQTYEVPQVEHTDAMVQQVESTLRAQGLAEVGDYVVVVAGTPEAMAMPMHSGMATRKTTIDAVASRDSVDQVGNLKPLIRLPRHGSR